MKRLFKYIFMIVLVTLVWFSYQYYSIATIGENSEPLEADVIIVLGAAVWPNGPSPALQARVVHGATIYQEGLAQNIILTGGLGNHPPSEAQAMYQAITQLGIPADIIMLEELSTNTRENIELSKEIMASNNWKSAIIVTDTFHIKRALMIAQDFDIQAYGAPAKNSVLYTRDDLRISYTLREVLAITQYYFHKILGI